MDAKQYTNEIYIKWAMTPGFFDTGAIEAIISSALSAQAAEVERLRDGIKRARDQIESFGLHFYSLKIYPEYDRALRCMIDCDALLPPAAQEVKL